MFRGLQEVIVLTKMMRDRRRRAREASSIQVERSEAEAMRARKQIRKSSRGSRLDLPVPSMSLKSFEATREARLALALPTTEKSER